MIFYILTGGCALIVVTTAIIHFAIESTGRGPHADRQTQR